MVNKVTRVLFRLSVKTENGEDEVGVYSLFGVSIGRGASELSAAGQSQLMRLRADDII